MNVERQGVIGGQKIKTVRDMLASAGRYQSFCIDAVEEHLQKTWWRATLASLIKQGKLSPNVRGIFGQDWEWPSHHSEVWGVPFKKMSSFAAPAQKLIKALLKEALIEEHSRDAAGVMFYRCTIKGQALRMARFVPRINRSEVEELLTGVLQRVTAINASDELLHWVTEVRVFGSYLTNAEDFGDLDVAIKLEWRPVAKWSDACFAIARASGKNMALRDPLFYPERLLRQRIKNRSPYISLHDASELDANPAMGGRTVYRFMPPKG